MSDEEAEVEAGEAPVQSGSTDQGPYTGQSMEIPTEPYNPVGGMTQAEIDEAAEANRQAEADAEVEARERRREFNEAENEARQKR
jgi:hypothetical protein